MTEKVAYEQFKSLRWPDGIPTCPHCQCKHSWVLDPGVKWKCKNPACRIQYTVTSKTPLASRKLSFRDILAIIAIFANGAFGVAALRTVREVGISYKTAFVLQHKIREAMGLRNDEQIDGVVEIDGAFMGTRMVRLPNSIPSVEDWKEYVRTNPKKLTSLVVMRQRPNGDSKGRVLTVHTANEGAAIPDIRKRLKKGTLIQADAGTQWEPLNFHFVMKRINHSDAFSKDGACTNWAESFFSRVRSAERGVYRYWTKRYVDKYGLELAWREENSRIGNREQVKAIMDCVMQSGLSSMKGYWQRHKIKPASSSKVLNTIF